MSSIRRTYCLLAILLIVQISAAQTIQLGEVLIMMSPALRDGVGEDALRKYISEDIGPAWNTAGSPVGYHLFRADRGQKKGTYLLVCSAKSIADRKRRLAAGSPFSDAALAMRSSKKPSAILTNQNSYTEYHFLGSESGVSLPAVALLGIHYLKVIDARARDFEKFVVEKMHPAVANLLPDMHLLTYKAVAGDAKGTYITIFAIESDAARHGYWPEGQPETGKLKEAFAPLQQLANELRQYLVSDSYLEPGRGAAAIFESKEWTDFAYVTAPK